MLETEEEAERKLLLLLARMAACASVGRAEASPVGAGAPFPGHQQGAASGVEQLRNTEWKCHEQWLNLLKRTVSPEI